MIELYWLAQMATGCSSSYLLTEFAIPSTPRYLIQQFRCEVWRGVLNLLYDSASNSTLKNSTFMCRRTELPCLQ